MSGVTCIVPHLEGENPAPHPSGAGVYISNGSGRGKTRGSFTLGQKKRALDSMGQRLNMKKVSEYLTGISRRVLRQMQKKKNRAMAST